MSLPALLGAVARASLAPLLDAGGIERAADDLVADARQVSNAAGSHQDDRVLLQVVSDARDVRRDLDARGQADAGDLAQGRVRLLGGGRVDARADAPPLRGSPERGSLGLLPGPRTALAHELLDRRHGPLACTLDLSPNSGPDVHEAGPRARLPGRNVVAQVVPFGKPLEAHRIPDSPAEPGATAERTRHEACLSTKGQPACVRTPRRTSTPSTMIPTARQTCRPSIAWAGAGSGRSGGHGQPPILHEGAQLGSDDLDRERLPCATPGPQTERSPQGLVAE